MNVVRALPSWCRIWLILSVALVTTACHPARGDDPPDRIIIATWNVEWFFDADPGDNQSELAKSQTAPSQEDWNWKLDEVARVVAAIQPTILALQEVENRRVLVELAQRLRDRHQLTYRVAFAEGGDVFTEQDVGILFQSGLTSYSRREQTREMFDSRQFYNVQKHLFADFEWRDSDRNESLALATVHFRARPEQDAIRMRQGRLMHEWLRPRLLKAENVILLGDLNTEVRADGAAPDNDLGPLMGLETDDTRDDFVDLHALLAPQDRATHLGGSEHDRLLVSRALFDDDPSRMDLAFAGIRVRRDLVVRGRGPDRDHFENYYGIPADERDVSDHYPVVAEFVFR